MKLLKFAEVRKAVAAVVGLAAEAVATGVLSGTVLHVAQAILAVATVAGVYGVRNGKVGSATVGSATVGTITAHLKLDAGGIASPAAPGAGGTAPAPVPPAPAAP